MSNLRDLDLKISYGPSDDRLREFFIPAMATSIRYDRAAGYFSSTMLAVAAAGVTRLILNGGKMRLLCGADLSQADVEAIEAGHATLAQQVEQRLITRFVLPESDFIENRLKALAWLVGTGQLEIKVVLPTDPHGRPLSASRSESYYHPKEGLFVDAAGNRVGFSGSVNESAKALEDNYESFMVFNSWGGTAAHLAQIGHRFDRLWEAKERDWIALPVPEAVRQKLLMLRPDAPPEREFGADEQGDKERGRRRDTETGRQADAGQRERIIFQFLRDVPRMPNADRLGAQTCTVRPWPHQNRVADKIVKRFPERFLLCDEVGLGKTIEAGLAIRQLVLSGRVRRALVLVPKSVLVQWQEELYEKFVLNVPRYDGETFFDVFGREVPGSAGDNPWNAHPIVLASSHLAKRRDRQQQLLAADDWDLVVVDEAHHARRKDFQNTEQFRPNRLLELLLGPEHGTGLREKTRGLLLLTATPMQIDPREVFDLLKLLGMGGRWGVEGNFLRYFDELRQPFEEVDWAFMLAMLDDYFATGGEWDEPFCRVAEERLGPVVWHELGRLHDSSNAESVIRQLSGQAQGVLRELAARHTPLRRHIFRNTRSLLREYHRRGLLKEKIPYRDPKPEWIPMKTEEEKLYHRIEEYIRDHYQKYEAERRGLGFIMTVYRRRLTSSFYAIERSLERRLAYLKGETGAIGVTDEDIDEDDLEDDVSELLPLDDSSDSPDEKLPPLFLGEIEYVRDFLGELRALGADSKFEQLAGDLSEVLRLRDSVIVFTQYTDTMDYLREKLRPVYGAQVACYSGRGGERWEGGAWVGTSKENIKTAFRESREIKILLCTESASEGLNLQTCGVLINYEMPWNPMRVEQRIGRIDRIGQTYDRVWIRNYFYDGTVEADVYQRLDDRIASFESVVGELQPILSQVAKVIEAAAMANDKRRGELIAKEIEEINRRVRSAETASLNLDELTAAAVEPVVEQPAPVTLPDLERVIATSAALGDRFWPHRKLAGAHLLDWHGNWREVTFDPALFDEHPNSLTLLSYGSDLLGELLDVVDAPQADRGGGVVARCCVAGQCSAASFFRLRDLSLIPSLTQLLTVLEKTSSSAITADRRQEIEHQFLAEVQHRLEQDEKTAADRYHAHLSSLREEIRQLLVEAAYVELALATKRELFDEVLPLDFSEAAYQRLKRHKAPFAGAIKVVGVGLPRPSADDARFVRFRDSKRDVLLRRFDAIRAKLGGRLSDLMGIMNHPPIVLPEAAAPRPTIECYGVAAR